MINPLVRANRCRCARARFSNPALMLSLPLHCSLLLRLGRRITCCLPIPITPAWSGVTAQGITAMIRSLGRVEIALMIAEQGGAEVICHFCNEARRYDAAELEALRLSIPDAVGEA